MPDANEALLGELSAALSDIVAALERRDGNDEIASALSDLVVAIEKRDGGHAELIEAIRSIRMPEVNVAPQINVQPTPVRVENKVSVSPTPITVEAIIPPAPAPIVQFAPAPAAPVAWEIRIAGQYGAPDRVVTMTPKFQK